MIVKVIIKREIKPGMEAEFFARLKTLRFGAIHQEGYISGETLICAENTNKVLIISQWDSLDAWERWKKDETRKEIDETLNRLQTAPATYEPYVFSKYKAAAQVGFPPPLQKMRL